MRWKLSLYHKILMLVDLRFNHHDNQLDLSNPHKYGPKAKQVWDVWDHWYNIFSIENPCKEAKELAERIKEVGKKHAEIFRCDPYPLH